MKGEQSVVLFLDLIPCLMAFTVLFVAVLLLLLSAALQNRESVSSNPLSACPRLDVPVGLASQEGMRSSERLSGGRREGATHSLFRVRNRS